MESKYPKTVKLHNKKEIVIRPLEKGDFDIFVTFLRSLPEEDRLFRRSDVTRLDELRRMFDELSPDHVSALLALHEAPPSVLLKTPPPPSQLA